MKRIILLTALSCLYFINAQAQVTRYVKPVASGTGDGSSWVNASSDLQLMINNSASGDLLFVAAGTYQALPGASYVMKEGVKIYGGFAGTETLLSQRNWTTNVTILRGDNASVVRNFFNGLTVAAVLDGFTITNGTGNVGNSAGGGILNQSVNPTISNCIITGNIAYWGGGMSNNSCSPTINNCTFSGNTGNEGGGMYNNPRMPNINNCTFVSNSAPQGGGMYNYTITSGGTIANCSFTNNVAANGGAIYSFYSKFTIHQSTFSENHANNYNTSGSGYGGVFYNYQDCNISITGSTFINNTSYRSGGVMENLFSTTSIADSYFAGNNGSDGGVLVNSAASTATISRSTFLQNTASYAGGAFILYGDAAFNSCIFSGNNSHTGGAAYSAGGNTIFTNCLLTGNASTMGSASYSYGATTTFNNSTIAGNNGPSGSVLSEGGSTTNINNSIVWGNSTAIANNSSTINVQYSIVQGGYAGTGNQNTDPQFLFLPSYTTAPFINGDFHPSLCSPVINAGNNALVDAGNTNDLGFTPRIIGPAADLGVYEFGVIPSASNIIFVNSSVPGGTNTGSSWNDAKRSLSEVLRYVKANENLWTASNPLTIYVAKGTYKPLYRAENPCSSVNPFDRDNTFLMVNNVKLYGGFDPANGIDDLSDARIFGPGGSTLSGDLGAQSNNADNSYHTVVFSGTGNSASLDGFSITGGNANVNSSTTANGATIERNNGGGIFLFNSSPTLAYCIFETNSSSNYGGALYAVSNSGFTANNCTFGSNTAVFGGSIFNNGSIAVVNNGYFISNSAGYGGALYDHNAGYTSVTGSTFSSNSAGLGGACYVNSIVTPAYTNCSFTSNTSSNWGGAVFCNQSGPTMTNCNFTANTAAQNGGAVYNYSTSNPIFNNCSFSSNNSGSFGGAIYSEATATTKFTRCDFTSNFSQFGGAILNGSNLNMESCSFSTNQAASYGGAVYNTGAQQVFSNCVFTGNQTINGGGAGGAIFNNYTSGSCSIINNTFYNNTATFGGAVHNWSSATATIRNSVIWNNSSAVSNESAASATVQNTLIQGGYAGTGNINADPLFTNPAQPKGVDGIWGTNDDGFHLQPCSPAINVGVNASIFPGVVVDFSGQPRIQYVIVDMGAYEANSIANASASNIVSVNTTVNVWQVANAATYYASNCTSLVAAVTGSGAPTTISGNTTAKVWIETTQPQSYVKRHYEITPQTNAGTATATITLYFTQAEFNAFNAVNAIKLPQSPADATGKANFLIEKRSGTSNDGTGNPFSYTGSVATINPTDADIIWNATASRWEVSFAVTGFSGFFVKTQLFTLPLRLVSFTAEERSCITNLQWTTKEESNVSHFDLQQSNDGISFNTIKTITAKNTGNENNYVVNVPVVNNKMFYRLKMVDIDDKATYSHVASITAVCDAKIVISPNPAKDKLYIRNASIGSQYAVYDNNGRRIRNGQIGNTVQEVSVTGIASGIYSINIIGKNGSDRRVSFVKE